MSINGKSAFGKQAVVVAVVIAFLTGCATVFSGKTQSVTFHSTPSGATIMINGATLGVTPLTTLMEKKTDQTLTLSKEGYKTFTTQMTTQIDGWFWGNILGTIYFGFFSSTTDGVTGAMRQFTPNQYIVSLEPESGSKISGPTEKSKKDKAREFIILSYNQLMADIAKGAGNYQNSLMTLLEIAKGEEAVAIKRIKSISDAYPDIAQFADQVANAFLK